jgi:GAF domain-containing protein
VGLGLPTGAAGSHFDDDKAAWRFDYAAASGAVIPLISQKGTWGLLGIASNGPGAIRPDEIQTDGSAD